MGETASSGDMDTPVRLFLVTEQVRLNIGLMLKV
jgi:hypothetical protein